MKQFDLEFFFFYLRKNMMYIYENKAGQTVKNLYLLYTTNSFLYVSKTRKKNQMKKIENNCPPKLVQNVYYLIFKMQSFLFCSHMLWLNFKVEFLSKNSIMKVNYNIWLHMILLCITDILKQTFSTSPVIEPYEYHFQPDDYDILLGKS